MRRRSDERGEQPLASTTDVSYSSSALSRARRSDLRPTTAAQRLHCRRSSATVAFPLTISDENKCSIISVDRINSLLLCRRRCRSVIFTEIDGATRPDDTDGFNLLLQGLGGSGDDDDGCELTRRRRPSSRRRTSKCRRKRVRHAGVGASGRRR